MKKTKVLLADDHAIVIEGLRVVLNDDENIEVVGEVYNGEEALRFVRNKEVDCVVLDINMPVMDGITCARNIKEVYPDVKIIILTMYPQRSFVDEILKIGIDGCLLKNNTGKELKEAIRVVMSGKPYYERIGNFKSDLDEVTQYKISERELEIIKLIVDGMTSGQIAEKLFISEHTVKTHRKNILAKMGLANTSQLIQFAVSKRIV